MGELRYNSISHDLGMTFDRFILRERTRVSLLQGLDVLQSRLARRGDESLQLGKLDASANELR
jgi:hypothetical protein